MRSLRGIVVLLAGAVVLGAVAIAGAATFDELPSELQAVKAATALYHAVGRAEQDGYLQSSPCEQSPAGAMGYHFANQALAMDPAIDPLRPEVLLYEPKGNGDVQLVGVEYFGVALANTPSGPAPWFGPTPPPGGFFNPAPVLFGQSFDGPMAGHSPEMPWHYDLHVWIWESNPSGTFAQWNPRVSCP